MNEVLLDNDRILIIDDNRTIHDDFRKMLAPAPSSGESLDELEAELFGAVARPHNQISFQLTSAYQGQEGLAAVEKAVAAGQPFAMAFVDVQMPPGWDGIQTLERIWKVDPDLQAVVCTAYSDHTWQDISDALGQRDNLLILKKPFDNIEVIQLAHAMMRKWSAQKQLHLQITTLDERVQERTRKLEQMLARALEQEKLASLGVLAAGVAHEINNPIGYTASLLRSAAKYSQRMIEFLAPVDALVDSVQAGDLENARQQAERLRQNYEAGKVGFAIESMPNLLLRCQEGTSRVAKIVEDLLTFSRNNEIEASSLAVESVVDSAINILATQKEEQVTFRREYGTTPPILGNTTKLTQVFVNILNNALQACDGDGEVVVTTHGGESSVAVAVIDRGCGIPAENLGKLFDPFFTTKSVGTGTGLGLNIAYNIVQQHGGQIRVDSQVGRGTTFTVELPRAG